MTDKMTDEEAAKAFADSTIIQTGDTEFEKLTRGPLRDLVTKAVLFGCAHTKHRIWETVLRNARESITDQEYLFLQDVKKIIFRDSK